MKSCLLLNHAFIQPEHLSCHMTKPTNWRAPSEDSDQPRHPPDLIRVFAVRSMGSQDPNASSCGQRKLWSDCVDAHTDLVFARCQRSFCWFSPGATHFVSLLKACYMLDEKSMQSIIKGQDASRCCMNLVMTKSVFRICDQACSATEKARVLKFWI